MTMRILTGIKRLHMHEDSSDCDENGALRSSQPAHTNASVPRFYENSPFVAQYVKFTWKREPDEATSTSLTLHRHHHFIQLNLSCGSQCKRKEKDNHSSGQIREIRDHF